jgi:hypothetical protein
MGNRVIACWVGVCAFVVAGSATAFAQDYVVSSATGQWVAPPSNAVDLGLIGDDSAFIMSSNTPWTNAGFPPFPISYYGRNFSSSSQFAIMTNGYLQLGGTTSSGCCSPFGSTTPPAASGTTYDGFISLAWNDDHSGTLPGKIYAWTNGTSPNRRFIISYTNWAAYGNQSNSSLNFQVQFYEAASTTPGRIVIAYNGSWTAGSTYTYGVGIDEYQGAGRFTRPPAPGSTSGQYTFTSTPPNDWIFDPKITTFTGTVQMDKYVVDGSGIGNVKELAQPASGLTVELRDSTGAVAASGVTDATGAFSMRGIALIPTQIGTLWISGQNPVCAVRSTTGGTSAALQLATGVAFSADKNVGTLSITEANDPGGVARAPLNIASTIQGVNTWCSTRTTKTIPFLEVLFSPSNTTFYNKPGATPAQMGISGLSSNADGWDRSIIRRTYARHVLGAVSGYPTTAFDNTYDKVTDDANAFAEGFGYYLHFAINGATATFYDGISSSTSLSLNLEEPPTPLTSPRGSNVAAWCALALYDLTDPANEPWDAIDGTAGAEDRPFRTVAALTSAPTADSFCTRWGQQGYDGVGLSTSFIRHGMLSDDADEPNDLQPSARPVTQFGFIRPARVLNLYNEDWYSFIMPQPTNKLTGTLLYDRTTYNTTVQFELHDSAGALIASGNAASSTAPFVASTGALPSGTYFIRVKHTGGVRLPTYEISAFSELAFSAAALAPWTVGRPINLPVNIKGGIPPYNLSVEAPFVKPPGLILDGVNGRVIGVPSKEGLFPFILSASDSANPKNFASGPQSFRVNPVLELTFGEFVALPDDKDISTRAAYVGGTAPYTTSVDQGELPGGVAIDPLDIRFTGHPDTAGSFPLKLTGTDVAGSTATQSVTAVVCSASGAIADMATGRAACGYWFDAVKGSVVKVGVKTVSKMPKRALRVQVIDADGITALDAKTTGRKGSASVSGFVAPSTGRFYVVVASDEGEATQLVGAVKVTPTKKGKGDNPDINFVAGKQYIVRLGALEGAELTFTAKPDAGSGLALKPVLYMINPEGEIHSLDPLINPDTEITMSKGSFTIKATLDMSGTWQILIGAFPGPQGHFKYSYKIAEPKDVTYQHD